MTQTIDHAAAYRAAVEGKQEVVDVTLPTNNYVVKMAKPSNFTMTVLAGLYPRGNTAKALAEWGSSGKMPENFTEQDYLALTEYTNRLRDFVIDHSRYPRLVLGLPANDNEMCIASLTELDSDYLVKWLQSGGNPGVMLGNFSEQLGNSSLASSSKRKVRSKSAK